VVTPENDGKPRWWLPSKPKTLIPYLRLNSPDGEQSNKIHWSIGNHLDKRYEELTFVPMYEASSTAAIHAMVLEGYGMAWLPLSIVSSDLESGKLVRAAKVTDDIEIDIRIYRFHDSQGARVIRFWDVIEQLTEQHNQFFQRIINGA